MLPGCYLSQAGPKLCVCVFILFRPLQPCRPRSRNRKGGRANKQERKKEQELSLAAHREQLKTEHADRKTGKRGSLQVGKGGGSRRGGRRRGAGRGGGKQTSRGGGQGGNPQDAWASGLGGFSLAELSPQLSRALRGHIFKYIDEYIRVLLGLFTFTGTIRLTVSGF